MDTQVSLVQRATAIRQIAEEGLLYDEILRKKKQNACTSWAFFTGGSLVAAAAVIASVYLSQQTIQNALIGAYEKSETTRDFVQSFVVAYSMPVDQPFLPTPIARQCLSLKGSYLQVNTSKETADIVSLTYDIQEIERTRTAIQHLQSTAEQNYLLVEHHLSIHSIHTRLQDELTIAQRLHTEANSKRCTFSLYRTTCAEAEAAFELIDHSKKTLESQSKRLETFEGTLEVLYERDLLPAYLRLMENVNTTELWYTTVVNNAIPYDNLTVDYVATIKTQFEQALYERIIGTGNWTSLAREAHTYFASKQTYRFLSLIKEILTRTIDGKQLIVDSYHHIHDRQARDSQYMRARGRVDSDMTECREQKKTTLLCDHLLTESNKVITWINNIERFQLPLPANFIQVAYQTLMMSEITSMSSIRDFQRYERIEVFRKNPSYAFLILTGIMGIGLLVMGKLILFDLPYTYLRLLLLPAEYATKRIQFSIDELQTKSVRSQIENGRASISLLKDIPMPVQVEEQVPAQLHILDAPPVQPQILDAPQVEPPVKPKRRSVRNSNRS